MTPQAPVLTVLGSLGAATIGGTIAFLVAVLSKEAKISEFRQIWISELRSDISEMLARAQVIAHAVSAKKQHGERSEQIVSFLFEKHDEFRLINALYYRIFLRLNPAEHSKLLDAVGKLASLTPITATDDEIYSRAVDVLTESRPVLKKEWTKVKRGETVFFLTLRFLLLAVVIGIVLVVHFGVIRQG